MRWCAWVAMLAVLGIAPAGGAHAQTGLELVDRGREAYHALEYDAAATMLRRGLELSGSEEVPGSARPDAYLYLGATELFRGRRASAVAAFRLAVESDPRFRPDTLVFPPQVTSLFDEVRRTTPLVSIDAFSDTTIVAGRETVVIPVHASAPHHITADIVAGEEGEPVRTLYDGPIVDGLRLAWDGLDANGTLPSRPIWLHVVSRAPDGTSRRRRLSLRVEPLPAADASASADAPVSVLPPPADSTLLPERTASGPAFASLATGMLVGLAAVALPVLASDDGIGGSGRFAVGASLSLAGIIGFITQRPGRPIPENIVANRAVTEAWQRQAAAANDGRDRTVRIRIRITPLPDPEPSSS